MPYGRGFGMGRGVGMGGGFRGAYAAWPYVGGGRGGLPRCGYFFANQAYLPPAYIYSPFVAGNSLDAMQSAAANLRDRLAQIQTRISEIEQQKTA
jgi:hypothetical protein